MEEGNILGQPATSKRELFSEDRTTCIQTQHTKKPLPALSYSNQKITTWSTPRDLGS